jgi:hypothetical protein
VGLSPRARMMPLGEAACIQRDRGYPAKLAGDDFSGVHSNHDK